MRRFLFTAGIALLLTEIGAILFVTPTTHAAPAQATLAASQFDVGIQRYVSLHRALEGDIPTVAVSDDYAHILAAVDALAAKIQSARRNARRGDIFTPDVERWLRQMIAASLKGCDIAAIVAAIDEENPPGVVFVPHVNGRWPESASLGPVPPQLLADLPQLPDDLQYRFLHRDLVLWDAHANLIVDFIRRALP